MGQSTFLESDSYPAFKLHASRFDQSKFSGRFRHFLKVIDPSTLFTSNAKLEESLQLLHDYENGTLPSNVTNKDLWKAQEVKQAIIHPDTNEKIWMPFRMSGFVPFGSPIVTGLLLPNPTLFQTVFWQWLNQTHNACVNYSNRNASKPTSVTRFLAGYVSAVGSAVSIAVGLSVLIKRANKLSPTMKMVVLKFVPFPAVALASVCNVVMMRNGELSEGIQVLDENDQVIGVSKIAAKKALIETATTRAVLPAPILVIPPLLMTMLEKTKWLQRNKRLHLPINALLVTVCFGAALPVAISLFPQMSKIKIQKLEPEIQASARDKNYLFYNKGL